MGEIADALRRARKDRALEPPSEARTLGSLPRAESSPPGKASLAAASHFVETIDPVPPAIKTRDPAALQACRSVALRIRSALEQAGANTVAVVSAVNDEGKTTVVCDIGLALGSLSGARDVALVDLDLRRPSLARSLGIRAEAGIERVLAGKARLEDVRVSVGRPAVDVYPAIEPQVAAHELLCRGTFPRVVQELMDRYAVVLVDTPPTLLVPDTTLILQEIPFCIPVARCGQTRARSFRQMLDVLPEGKVLGELLNAASFPRYFYAPYEGREGEPDAGAALSGEVTSP